MWLTVIFLREIYIILKIAGVKIVPVSNWTLAEKGLKQIAITGIDDKREMTAVLAATASGQLLPPQLLYQGKTEKCHPEVAFPEKWDIHHSANHWSNSDTMERYVDRIIIPYVEDQRALLKCPKQAAICIFDVFRAHQSQTMLDKLRAKNIYYTFVPASCTGELQPLDITLNKVYKEKLKEHFENWYSNKVEEELLAGVDIKDVKVNLNLTVIKPIHAQWLIDTHNAASQMEKLIKLGFQKAGIIQCDVGSDDTMPPPSSPGVTPSTDASSSGSLSPATSPQASCSNSKINVFPKPPTLVLYSDSDSD